MLAAFVGVAGVFLSLGVGSASAAATCVYDPNTDTATITLQNDTAVVSKGSLNHLNVNGVWCAPALINGDTNNNGVAYIWVVGNGDADVLMRSGARVRLSRRYRGRLDGLRRGGSGAER